MDAINEIAARHGLPVIEDAAQSFGATYRGRRSCHLSTLGCTSFFPSKPLGCYGDGGAVFTDDDELVRACREIRVHGQGGRYLHTRVGVGGRMDTLQCAVVLAKLERFDWELAQRRSRAERYQELLRGCAGVALPSVRAGGESAWAQFTLQVERRAALQAALQAQGVPTAVHYPCPIHHQPAYEHLAPRADFPRSVAAAARVLSLPISADLTDAQQDRVVDAVRAAASAPA
jgi:UDP-2-acetamido-2-deoxy-ribo-hexuluronate aminotransferase